MRRAGFMFDVPPNSPSGSWKQSWTGRWQAEAAFRFASQPNPRTSTTPSFQSGSLVGGPPEVVFRLNENQNGQSGKFGLPRTWQGGAAAPPQSIRF